MSFDILYRAMALKRSHPPPHILQSHISGDFTIDLVQKGKKVVFEAKKGTHKWTSDHDIKVKMQAKEIETGDIMPNIFISVSRSKMLDYVKGHFAGESTDDIAFSFPKEYSSPNESLRIRYLICTTYAKSCLFTVLLTPTK